MEKQQVYQQKKEEYQQKMEAQLKELTNKVAELAAKADTAQAELKVQYQEQIKVVRAKLDATQKRLQDLKKSSSEAWETFKGGTEKAWNELKDAVQGAASKFK